jgi:hypothetical protein
MEKATGHFPAWSLEKAGGERFCMLERRECNEMRGNAMFLGDFFVHVQRLPARQER